MWVCVPPTLPHPLHTPHTPTQNVEVGEKEVWYSPRVLVEGGDAQTLYVGETVTLLNWGNLVVTAMDKWVARRPLMLLGDILLG